MFEIVDVGEPTTKPPSISNPFLTSVPTCPYLACLYSVYNYEGETITRWSGDQGRPYSSGEKQALEGCYGPCGFHHHIHKTDQGVHKGTNMNGIYSRLRWSLTEIYFCPFAPPQSRENIRNAVHFIVNFCGGT